MGLTATKAVRTNWDRAGEAMRLCNLMQEMTGVDDLRSQISDAICHLMHLARLMRDENFEPIDFEDCLESARINFEAEVEEDPDSRFEPSLSN